jgi:hypothetical protein
MSSSTETKETSAPVARLTASNARFIAKAIADSADLEAAPKQVHAEDYPKHPEVGELVGTHSHLTHLHAEDGLKLVYYEKSDDTNVPGKLVEYKGKLEDVPFQGTVEIRRCNGPVTNVDGLIYYTVGEQRVKIHGRDVYIDGILVPRTFAEEQMKRGTKSVYFVLGLKTI